jgi:hypothetical protein
MSRILLSQASRHVWSRLTFDVRLRKMAMPDSSDKLILSLSPDEALVLFDFLSRFSDDDELRIDDQAEQRVLWDLCCLLERQLVEPFDENYALLLAQARSRVRDSELETKKGEQDASPNP